MLETYECLSLKFLAQSYYEVITQSRGYHLYNMSPNGDRNNQKLASTGMV